VESLNEAAKPYIYTLVGFVADHAPTTANVRRKERIAFFILE
jgi:hypothetical protein